MQNEREHCRGEAENAHNSIRRKVVLFVETFFIQCKRESKKQVSITFKELFLGVVIPDASIVMIETWFLGHNHKPRSHHQ